MRNRSGKNCATRIAAPQDKHRGLTLVELLVAISVLGFVALLGWRGLDSIIRARIALTSGLEQTRGMQLTFAQLQNDCAHLANPSVLPNRVPLAVSQERLTLVRTIFADNQPSRLQIITYQVKDGELTRRESVPTRDLRELDAIWLTTANGSDNAQAVVLQSGVAALTMRLWDSGGNRWHTGIGTNKPSASASTAASHFAPTGLEVALQLQANETAILKIFLLGAV